MNDEQIFEMNMRKCNEAMKLLYETYVTNPREVTHRGYAITAIDNWILAIQENNTPDNLSSAVKKMEATPWSKRMRESGEPLLQALVNDKPQT